MDLVDATWRDVSFGARWSPVDRRVQVELELQGGRKLVTGLPLDQAHDVLGIFAAAVAQGESSLDR